MNYKASLFSSAAIACCALAVLAQPASAQQQPVTGPYVSLGGGAQWLRNSKTTAPPISNTYEFKTGWAAIGAAGYGLGNGFRVEGEFGYRTSGVDKSRSGPATGKVNAYDLMVNGLYDFNVGWPVTPYVGLGLGAARVNYDSVTVPNAGRTIDGSAYEFAYQGIAGVAYAINQNLKLDVGYRYFGTADAYIKDSAGATERAQYRDHTVLVSLRWEFGAPPPPPPVQPAAVTPPPPPPVQAAPAPQIQRSYLVFFDFDKSNVSPEAERVIQQAATNAKEGHVSRIQATGHADRAGPESYNMALSIRRANAVKAALVREGIPESDIVVIGKGETQPLVPTPDGVREPQNRRVEILLQ